ncbi:solute carrier family facilitated glucose transporter member 9-like protein [Labeo rohita]|nr:solute carrier family facilitated glucose transporter member 9-like protein [Labeo rohita]
MTILRELYIQSFINSSWTYHYGDIPGEKTVTFIWSAVVALYALGGLIGSMTVRYFASHLGRKGTMLLNSAIGIVATVIMYISKPTYSFELILVARFLFGFGAGLGGNVHAIYLALQSLWGPGDYKLEIQDMLAEQAVIGKEHNKSLLDLLREKHLRWQITVFSFNVFLEAGIPVDKIRYVTLGIGASEVLLSITCSLFIETVGRKVLLWRGFGGMSTIMALITVALYLKDYSSVISYCTVVLIFLFIIFYAAGPAGIVPSLASEIVIQSYRPAAFMFTGLLRWLGFTMFGFIFPFLIAFLKSLSFVLFSCICLIAALYVYFILPETKDKTLLEISQEFKNIRVCGSSTEDVICLETKL